MIIDFKTSNLEVTINNVNSIEGLNRYKSATEGAISHWNREKENNHTTAEQNIQFFTEALNICTSKLKKLSK